MARSSDARRPQRARSAAAVRPTAAEARAASARCEEDADGLPASPHRAHVRARLESIGRGRRPGRTPRARRAPRRHLRRAARLGSRRRAPGHDAAVLSTARYYAYLQAADENGYPAARQLRDVLAAVHRSPVIQGAGAVFSTRGDDFVLTVGGDLAAGYRLHDREAVHLFCVETIAAQTVTAEAVCVLEA